MSHMEPSKALQKEIDMFILQEMEKLFQGEESELFSKTLSHEDLKPQDHGEAKDPNP